MSLDAGAAARAARLLGAARRERRAVAALPEDCRPADERDGYRIQRALRSWFAETDRAPAAGYKVGATTATMRDMLGVPGPACGSVRAPAVHASGARLAGRDFHAPGIECEIAFRIGRDFGNRPQEFDRREAARRIAAAMPAIEIVDDRYGDWRALGAPTLIADDFFQAACVLGPEAAGVDPMALDAAAGRTVVDGETLGEGRGADVLGHPLEVVLWLARKLAEDGGALEAGQIVLTGSMVRPRFLARRRAAARVEIDGLGAVEAALA